MMSAHSNLILILKPYIRSVNSRFPFSTPKYPCIFRWISILLVICDGSETLITTHIQRTHTPHNQRNVVLFPTESCMGETHTHNHIYYKQTFTFHIWEKWNVRERKGIKKDQIGVCVCVEKGEWERFLKKRRRDYKGDAWDRVHGRIFPRLEENQEAHILYSEGVRLAVERTLIPQPPPWHPTPLPPPVLYILLV